MAVGISSDRSTDQRFHQTDLLTSNTNAEDGILGGLVRPRGIVAGNGLLDAAIQDFTSTVEVAVRPKPRLRHCVCNNR